MKKRLLPLMVLLGAAACAQEPAAVGKPADAKDPPAARGGKARDYPPDLPGTRVETYRKAGDVELKIWIFEPEGGRAKPRPAIVFFFGGGWSSGSPGQFEPQGRHFARRGMVAAVADYRVASRHGVKPADCVADAKACIRWLRANAARLGVDPARIAAGGGSAGGHLAAATALLPGFEAPGEDTAVSSKPDALVLFNPALVLAPMPGVDLERFGDRLGADRLGCDPEAISPAHHVVKGAPPTLILHGRADTTVPFATVQKFADLMTGAGNRCDLTGYDGEPHGFFNARKARETLQAADDFLVSLGYLAARD